MKSIQPDKEFKFLLDAGYPRQSALTFVSDHHRLSVSERNKLNRMVFSESEIRGRRKRLVGISKIRGGKVAVDGYNVLITVETLLAGGDYFKCMDGFIRDNSMVFSSHRIRKNTFEAIDSILDLLKKYRPSELLFLYDSQVSRSGELAGFTRHEMNLRGLAGFSRTSSRVDYELKKMKMFTATSDSKVIELVGKVVDLPAAILKGR
jgi:hypothetical protein